MLLAQMTDFHVARRGSRLDERGRTAEHLARAIAHLQQLAPRPDAVICTGDLVDTGHVEEYERLAELLAGLDIPWYLVAGNHDDRENLRRVFAGAEHLPREGPLCYAVELGPLRLVVLDTNVPGEPGGRLDEVQLRWLDARLSEHPDRPTVVAQHHPPFRTGMQLMDRMGLEGIDGLAAVVARHPQVERILCGHVHRAITCRFAGTVASTCPSTAHQVMLDLRDPGGLAVVSEPPMCQLHLWTGTALVSHDSYVEAHDVPLVLAEPGGRGRRRRPRPAAGGPSGHRTRRSPSEFRHSGWTGRWRLGYSGENRTGGSMLVLRVLVCFASAALVGAAGCGGSSLRCGPGTQEHDGQCVAPDGGPTVSCGEGTRQEGGECVPVPPVDAALGVVPVLTAITPDRGLVGGGEPFTIEGSGFLAFDAGTTTITFGAAAVPLFSIESDTLIRGITPAATARTVTVTLTNDNGSDTAAFRYGGIYAADGKAGLPGSLYLIDPRNGISLAIGPVETAGGTGYGVSGMAFAPDGALFANEVNERAADARLLTIDPDTGTATVIGLLQDADDEEHNHNAIPDLAFEGDALIGWTEVGDPSDVPIAIDTATGEVTVLGPGVGSRGSGMAVLDDGTVVIAPNDAHGSLYTVDTSDGTATHLIDLTGLAQISDDSSVRVNAMTVFRGTLFATLNFDWDADGEGGELVLLATIDPDTGMITPLFAVSPRVDAIASEEPEAGGMARLMPEPDHALVARLRQGPARCVVGERGRLDVVSAHSRAVLPAAELGAHPAAARFEEAKRPDARVLALGGAGLALGGGRAVEVTSCGGQVVRLSPAELDRGTGHRLVRNQRGLVKLVDGTGVTRLRNVARVEVVP